MTRLAPLEVTDAERATAALTPAFLGDPTLRWCFASDADPVSRGVVLDTRNEVKLRFYSRFGFRPLARVPLGDSVEHILLRPRRQDTASR